MQENNNEEDEIDLKVIFDALRRHALVIIAVTVICGMAAFGYSKFCLTPQYESMSSLYMLTKETTLTSLADLQIGAQLTNDYQVIVTSRPVLQEVCDKLKLDFDYKVLKERLKIDNPQNTRILTITIQDPDPEMAKVLVDMVAATASVYIGDVMEMIPPKIIETGEVATEKCAPSNVKNAAIVAAIAFVLICAFYVVVAINNDTITTAEDVTKYLGISVIASVPLREDARDEADDKESISGKKKKK